MAPAAVTAKHVLEKWTRMKDRMPRLRLRKVKLNVDSTFASVRKNEIRRGVGR